MRNDERWRFLLEKLVATAEREDPTEGYLLDECRKLARGLADFLEGRWQTSPIMRKLFWRNVLRNMDISLDF